MLLFLRCAMGVVEIRLLAPLPKILYVTFLQYNILLLKIIYFLKQFRHCSCSVTLEDAWLIVDKHWLMELFKHVLKPSKLDFWHCWPKTIDSVEAKTHSCPNILKFLKLSKIQFDRLYMFGYCVRNGVQLSSMQF